MVDFRIDVVVDPKQAKSGTRQVDRALNKTEKEALDLRKALVDALSSRDAGATRSLQSIESILERTEQQALITDARISQIGKDINTANLQRANDKLKESESTAQRLGPLLKRVFAGVSVGLAVRQFVLFSDQLTNVQNRLRLVTSSTAELTQTQSDLLQIANETRSSFEATATIFNRLAVSAKDLGVTNRQLLDFTKSLNQAITLSGAASEEARAGLIQLSQGLASGALRGDELRSVLEQLPAVADVIAKSLGVTRGELRELGAEGKITADIVLEAFKEARGELNERFATTIPTIGQSFAVLQNKVIESVGAFNAATGAAEGLSTFVLLLANNIETLTIATGALSTVFLGRFAARAIPAAIAGVTSLNTAVLLTAPAIAAAAGALVFLGSRIQRYNSDLEAIGETLRGLEEDAKFISGTASQLTAAQREINNINRAIAEQQRRGGEASASQIARLQQLREGIDAARESIREQRNEVIDQAKAAEDAKVAQEAQAKSLERQAEILDELRNPNREFLQFQADLDALLTANKINLDEYNRLLAEAAPPDLSAGPAETPTSASAESNPFEEQLRSIREGNEELAIRAERFGLEEEALLIELDLRRQGIELTREQQDALAGALIEQQNLSAELGKQAQKEREIAEAKRDQERVERQEARRVERLERQVDVLGQIEEQQRRLNQLKLEEAELIPQIDVALENLRLRQLEAATDIAAGFERAFIRIGQEAADLAAVGESVVTTFADRATDALVEFARTGQFSFKEFASAVLDDLIRIIARLLIVQAIQSATGLGGAGAQLAGSAAQNAGRSGGGTVQPGQAPMPVGENGPELFVPGRTGTIVPNAVDAPVARPQVNVQVVMVEDPEAVPKAIASGAADEAIVVRAGENRERFQQAIGG